MPFTPLHMGPGLLIKAVLQGSFSLMIFGWTQIIMDIQPLIVLMTGEGHLHGFTHTYVGASLIAIASAVTGKYAAHFGLWLINQKQHLPISWPVAVFSGFIGAYSHVLLDSLMHADLQPFAPFDLANPFLRVFSAGGLHQFCLYSGVIGAVLYFVIAAYAARKT